MLLSLAIYHFGGKHLPETEHKKSVREVESIAHKPLTFLCIVTIFFWGVYEQQGNTLQLWSDQNTDWVFFGWEIPSTWYQSFNPIVIVLFAPLLDRVWA